MNFPIFDADVTKEDYIKYRILMFITSAFGIQKEEVFEKYGFEWFTNIEPDGIYVAIRTKYQSNIDYVNTMINMISKEKQPSKKEELQKELQEYVLNKEEGVLEGQVQLIERSD